MINQSTRQNYKSLKSQIIIYSIHHFNSKIHLNNAVSWGQYSQINKSQNQSIQLIIYKLLSQSLQSPPMNKDRNIIKGVSKNLPVTVPVDENKPRNIFKPNGKKDPTIKQQPKPVEPKVTLQQEPLTSYRHKPTAEEIQTRKWQCLTKFQQLNSKTHYIHKLRNATLFLSYSLAEKTVNLVLNEAIPFEYWVACCMFMPMKYEEIYPPRLKDLQPILKAVIDLKRYWDAEVTLLQYIGQDMNIVSLNTRLSEYLHAINKKERFFMFYLLELALYKRIQFRKFTEKELVLSIAYILVYEKLTLEKDNVIDGIPFERIEQCAKRIIMIQTEAQQSGNLVFKKYNAQDKDFVAVKGIPYLEGLMHLLMQKVNEPEKHAKMVGFCPPLERIQKSEMVDESEEIQAEPLIKKERKIIRFKPMYL